MLFRPENRLSNPHAYKVVFENGTRHYLKMGMYISYPNALNNARLGLILAKKKIRKANRRNYLKRLQRECFRQLPDALRGYDVVFVAHHKIAQVCQNEWFSLCSTDWQQLAKRLARQG